MGYEREVETEEERKKREAERKQGEGKMREEIAKALMEDIRPKLVMDSTDDKTRGQEPGTQKSIRNDYGSGEPDKEEFKELSGDLSKVESRSKEPIQESSQAPITHEAEIEEEEEWQEVERTIQNAKYQEEVEENLQSLHFAKPGAKRKKVSVEWNEEEWRIAAKALEGRRWGVFDD